jgi:hypothetical protein
VAAAAEDGRAFAGHYSLTNVVDDGAQVQLTLRLQLFNHTGTDLKQAQVLVHSSYSVDVLGTMETTELWRDTTYVMLNQQVTISRDEYQRWTRWQPGVYIVYSDSEGVEWTRTAQLNQRPLIPLKLSRMKVQ